MLPEGSGEGDDTSLSQIVHEPVEECKNINIAVQQSHRNVTSTDIHAILRHSLNKTIWIYFPNTTKLKLSH